MSDTSLTLPETVVAPGEDVTGITGLTPRGTTLPPEPEPSTAFGRIGAFGRREPGYIESAFEGINTIVNGIRGLSEEAFPADPNWTGEKMLGKLKGTHYEADHLDAFLGIGSEAEMEQTKRNIDRQLMNRDIYARSGIGGFVAAAAAGALDPTIFIPIGGWARLGVSATRATRFGIRALEAGAVTGAAVTAQETVLEALQETHTGEEALYNVLTATFVGAGLGGLLGTLSRGTVDGMAERVRRVPANTDDELRLWNENAGEPTAAGAAATDAERGTGELAGAAGATRVPILRNQDPLLRTTRSESRETRLTAYDLAETPLTRKESEEGVVATRGGPVEAEIREANYPLARALNKIDEMYSQYVFGRKVWFPAARGTIAAWRGSGKLSYSEFMDEVSLAWVEGDVHPIPEVEAAAKFAREHVLDFHRNAAADVGIEGFSRDMKPQSGDKGYMPRDYETTRIRAERTQFKREVLLPAAKRAQARAQKRIEEWRTQRLAAIDEEIADLELSGDARAATLTRLEEELKQTRETGKKFAPVERTLEGLRDRLRKARESGVTQPRWETVNGALTRVPADTEAIPAQIKAEVDRAGTEYADYVTKRNALATRVRRIRGNIVGRENQVESLRAKIADTEAANVDRLWRMHNAVAKLQAEMGDMAPEAIAAELAALRTDFAQTLERSIKAQDRLTAAKQRIAEMDAKAAESGSVKVTEDAAKADDALAAQQAKFESAESFRVAEMNKLADEIGELDDLDPEQALADLRMLIERRVSQSAEVVENAGRYMLALTERLRKADPELVKKRAAALKEKRVAVENRAGSQLAEMSDQEIDAALDEIIDNITQGSPTRMLMPAEVTSGPRGSLKARVLNFVSTKELRPYLVTNAEMLLRRYTRTMAPDIALTRKFGSVDMAGAFKNIDTAYNRKIDAATTAKERTRLDNARRADKRDLAAIRDRLRGTYAIPSDPEALAYRAGRVIKNINYMRLLGGMTASAFPDPGNIIAEYGLNRVMATAFHPFVRGLRTIKLSAKEGQMGGTALETTLDSRSMAIADIGDEFGQGSRFERGIQAASSKFGLVTLMAPWNQIEKSIVATIGQTRMLQFADRLAKGKKLDPKEMGILADAYIDPETAKVIAEQFAKHGEKDGGVWWANSGAWEGEAGQNAARIFRRGLAREIDKVIVTPGQDKPLWMSGGNPLLGQLGPIIGQFKTFGMASVQRTMMSRLQRRDMAALSGTLANLALGALVYYVKTPSDKLAAFDEYGVWATEAVDRSGLIGWLSDVNNVTEKLTRNYVGMSAFTGRGASRYASRNQLGAVLGPTFDAMGNIAQIIGGPFKEQGWSQADTHAARQLLLLQNVIWLKHAFDAVERGTNQAFGIPMRN